MSADITLLTIFVLAVFVGFEVVSKVSTTLHTPLMSGANAVSGITVVGALVVAGAGHGWISTVLGFLAIVFAMMNVAGGYVVTDRMLQMFRTKPTGTDAAADGAAAGDAGRGGRA